MKRIYSYCLVAILMLSLFGCDYLEAPRPEPSPPGIPLGYVFAGEHGSRFLEWDLSVGPYQFSADGSDPHTYTHIIDSVTLAKFIIYCTNSTSSSNSYVAATFGTVPDGLEVSTEVVVDSSFVCYDLSPDSTQGTIRHFVGNSSSFCNGQLYFEHLDSVTGVVAYDSAQRIDGTLPWHSSGGMFSSLSSSYSFDGSIEEFFSSSFPLWSDNTTAMYVGIRLLEGDRYRYGYIKASAGESSVRLWHVAIEL